jgi:hypothetical protein
VAGSCFPGNLARCHGRLSAAFLVGHLAPVDLAAVVAVTAQQDPLVTQFGPEAEFGPLLALVQASAMPDERGLEPPPLGIGLRGAALPFPAQQRSRVI